MCLFLLFFIRETQGDGMRDKNQFNLYIHPLFFDIFKITFRVGYHSNGTHILIDVLPLFF